jgi:glutaredoxin-like protein NrdH
MTPITVYTKPARAQCAATFRALERAGLHYIAIRLTALSDRTEETA